MPDLFDLFRWLLGIVVTVYATVVTFQWAWSWWIWLTRPQAGYERHFSVLRRYLVLHGLRLRLARFGGDLLVSIGLCIVFLLLFQAHIVVYDMPRTAQPPRHLEQAQGAVRKYPDGRPSATDDRHPPQAPTRRATQR